jgi:F-type H+-transporting ATPase subunit b
MSLNPLSAALVAAGGGGLTDVDLTLTVSTLVLFLIFAFVLAKFGWKPLLQMIEEREKGIREAVLGAERANAEAQAALAQHREMLRDAGREREEILKRAIKESDLLRQELVGKARAESEQALQRARDQIARETAAAIQELRTQVAGIAMEAAAKIVTSSLTPETQRKLVDDYITELPKAQ